MKTPSTGHYVSTVLWLPLVWKRKGNTTRSARASERSGIEQEWWMPIFDRYRCTAEISAYRGIRSADIWYVDYFYQYPTLEIWDSTNPINPNTLYESGSYLLYSCSILGYSMCCWCTLKGLSKSIRAPVEFPSLPFRFGKYNFRHLRVFLQFCFVFPFIFLH